MNYNPRMKLTCYNSIFLFFVFISLGGRNTHAVPCFHVRDVALITKIYLIDVIFIITYL